MAKAIKGITIRPAPWNWLIALIVLQAIDLASTRFSMANAIMIEGNPLLAPIVTAWWFLVVKASVVTGVGTWLVFRRADKILQIATWIYLGIITSNIVLAIRAI